MRGSIYIPVGSDFSDVQGTAAFAVESGRYDYNISNVPAGVGTYSGVYDITTDSTQLDRRQTSEQLVSVSGEDLTSVTMNVYQLDSLGAIVDIKNPNLTITSQTYSDTGAVDITTELFAGQYRFVITGVNSSGQALATQMTDPITIAGGGATETPENIDLSTSGKALSLTLQDPSGDPLTDPNLYLSAFDAVTGLFLGKSNLDSGNGSFLLDTGFIDVVVLIQDNASSGTILGLYRNNNLITDDIRTLTQVDVSGAVEPPSGSPLDGTDTASVVIESTDVPDSLVTHLNQALLPSVTMQPGTGVYSTALFPGNYEFRASSVKGYPDVTNHKVTTDNSPVQQNIAVAIGGVITGRVQDEANNNLTGVMISVQTGNSLSGETVELIGTAVTDNEGVYSLEVPFGSYVLVIGGAFSHGLVVSSTSPMEVHNITRFQITGRVIDESGAGLRASARVLNGDSDVAESIGIYKLQVYEGVNNFCFLPPTVRPTLGLSCSFAVEVSQSSVDALN